MQPFRTPTRVHIQPRSTPMSHRTLSPLKESSKQYHVPLFSRPPGPTKGARLSRNSLFPNTSAVQNAAISMRQQLKTTLQQSQNPQGHVSAAGTQNTSLSAAVSDLTLEEQTMEDSLDFSRWNDPSYRLRQDEMNLFLDILNHSSLARCRGIMFKQSPDSALARVMDAWLGAPDSSTSLTDHVSVFACSYEPTASSDITITTHNGAWEHWRPCGRLRIAFSQYHRLHASSGQSLDRARARSDNYVHQIYVLELFGGGHQCRHD